MLLPLPLILCALLIRDVVGQRLRTPDPAKRALHRLEKIDVDAMLRNNRIMTSYVRCFVGKGACSPEGRDFRKLIPKMTATACGDCTPNQRRIMKKIFLYMYRERNGDWKVLQQAFDPKHKFEDRICNFMGLEKKDKAANKTVDVT